MHSALTKKGVLIDICSSCKGVWLDQGEINFFIKNRKDLRKYEQQGLEQAQPIKNKCPKCQSPIRIGQIPGLSYTVEECTSCKGIYFDHPEFQKLQNNKSFLKIQFDPSIFGKSASDQKRKPFRVKLPSLAFTSMFVGLSLYGLLFGVIVFLMEAGKVPISIGITGFILSVVLQFFFGPILLDWQLKWLGSLQWTSIEKLPTHFKDALLKLCHKNRIPIPKIGIIHDGSPQAYTYGRTPYSARVVFSKGMFELLEPDEVEAVLAHEIGHIKHWDFVFMTLMRIVPAVLYMIYNSIKRSLRTSVSKRDNKGKAALLASAIVAYIAYRISEYLVLFVSRVREYYADRFSCFATKKPNKLLTALVKISYGLLNSQTSSKDNSYPDKQRSVAALNIMGVSSKQLSLANHPDSGFNPKTIMDVMKWDLWNPWGFYYELHSTHPLTAKRINAINSYTLTLNQTPYISFRETKPESYWDEFFVDLFVLLLPAISGLCGVLIHILYGDSIQSVVGNMTNKLIYPFLLFFSIGGLIKTLLVYPRNQGKFFRCPISSLLKVVKVSPVRSYPVVVKGEIIGRGHAGSLLSEDFFLKDKTGMIFLDHEPFGLNIWFAIRHFEKFNGKKVTVRGWYRRAPSPYIEVKSIVSSHGDRSQAYTFFYKIVTNILILAVSLFFITYV